ncbi:MAG TPA: serine/threonine-protein kinase [Polyangiaceae bacterium]
MSTVPEAAVLPHLAKYEIVEELGHGGMATVYRARDQRLHRDVAVKIIHKHLRESKEVSIRFEAEARAVAKLRHPNIIEVYDVSGEDDADKYIVVELSRGITLRLLLARFGEMPPEVAAALGIELASALSHAHAAGVIHRDLKPENVLVDTEHGVSVKLTDFGIAKILDAQGVTSTGQVLGSPAHMAPEQIEGGEVDARADVFGLGVLLYECMVGHLPFEGKNPAQVLRRVLEGSYSPPDRERPSVGGRWAKILARALARDAVDRYPSAEAFMDALRDELASLEISDPAAELRAFFTHPEEYRSGHAKRLVPILTERGERARKAKDPHGAAADFNRALAYAPQDAVLLKWIGRLQRGRATRRALLTGLVVAVSSGAVVMAAFAAKSAFWRPPPPQAPVPPSLDSATAVPAPPMISAAPSATLARSALPPRSLASERQPPRHNAEPPVGQREVSFVVIPKGALVSVDGQAAEELFLKTKRLSVGTHRFRVEVPPPSKCCEPLQREEEIKPDDGTGTAQQVSLSLSFRDATLSVPDAPAGAQLRCAIPRIAGAASHEFPIKMSTLEQDISCELDAPGVSLRRLSITLRAGELTAVPWSAP